MAPQLLFLIAVKKVLAIDKDPFIRYLLVRTLQSAATAVVTGSRPEDVIAGRKSRAYDLFLVDMQVLSQSGFEALRLLKEQSPNAKILLMSTSVVDCRLPEEHREMIDCFILKPFRPSQMRLLVGRTMGLEEYIWQRSLPTADGLALKIRRQERRRAEGTIEYVMNGGRRSPSERKLRGALINISDSGLGMLTGYPIASGTLLTFCSGSERNEGIAVWNRKVADNSYETGVFLV